ncbi:MAG: GTP-dependent dephospho-CoA kinase family protein [Promethearchaeota archaeon]
MGSQSKKQLIRAQAFTLFIIVYTLFNVISVSMLKEYLFYDGLVILIGLYILPSITVFSVFHVYIKRVFTKPHRSRWFKIRFRKKVKEKLTDMFLHEKIKVWMMPPELRPMLAEIHGDLIAGTEDETRPVIKEYIMAHEPVFLAGCGDVISKNLIAGGFIPNLIVIDGKTCRKDYEINVPEDYELVEVTNVVGGITRESWIAIKSAINSLKNTMIKVTAGEEDLLVIPLVLLAPVGSIVAYGQPPVTDLNPPRPAGAVMVKVTAMTKEKFKNILLQFKPVGN